IEPSLEFSHKSDFGFEVLVEAFSHGLLSLGNQLANVLRGRTAQVDHDVGMDVGDLGVSHSMSFHSALVHQSSRADALDLLEDRASARMPVEPRMPTAAPAEILLQH